jgi:hypothetical protein
MSASFLGFYTFLDDDVFVDDSFVGRHNIRYATLGSEAVGHLRQGGPLFLNPESYNQMFFVLSNASHKIDILRTSIFRAYYRKRLRLL